MRHPYGVGQAGLLVAFLFLLLVIGAVAGVAAWLATRGSSASPSPGATPPGATPPGATPPAGSPPGSARALLDDRLARGEIDVDEYRERRSALEQP